VIVQYLNTAALVLKKKKKKEGDTNVFEKSMRIFLLRKQQFLVGKK
jgi:hypothetical protein